MHNAINAECIIAFARPLIGMTAIFEITRTSDSYCLVIQNLNFKSTKTQGFSTKYLCGFPANSLHLSHFLEEGALLPWKMGRVKTNMTLLLTGVVLVAQVALLLAVRTQQPLLSHYATPGAKAAVSDSTNKPTLPKESNGGVCVFDGGCTRAGVVRLRGGVAENIEAAGK